MKYHFRTRKSEYGIAFEYGDSFRLPCEDLFTFKLCEGHKHREDKPSRWRAGVYLLFLRDERHALFIARIDDVQ